MAGVLSLTQLCCKFLVLFNTTKTQKMQNGIYFILPFLLSDMKCEQLHMKTVLLTDAFKFWYEHNNPTWFISQGHFSKNR